LDTLKGMYGGPCATAEKGSRVREGAPALRARGLRYVWHRYTARRLRSHAIASKAIASGLTYIDQVSSPVFPYIRHPIASPIKRISKAFRCVAD